MVDRDVVPLWCLSNLYGTDTVKEVDSPPDRRAGDIRGVDEFGDRKLRVVSVGEQSEDIIRGADTKDIGLCVGIRTDTDRYTLSSPQVGWAGFRTCCYRAVGQHALFSF